MAAPQVLTTDRLTLRQLHPTDASFLLELLNEPAFLRFIGDRHVRTPAQARAYIADGPVAMYGRLGFGMYRVELRHDRLPIGICGLVQRDFLPDVDLGYAFLERYWGRGYAHEAAAAALAWGRETLDLPRVVAMTLPDNQPSIRLLAKLGMSFVRTFRLPGGTVDLSLYSTPDPPPTAP